MFRIVKSAKHAVQIALLIVSLTLPDGLVASEIWSPVRGQMQGHGVELLLAAVAAGLALRLLIPFLRGRRLSTDIMKMDGSCL